MRNLGLLVFVFLTVLSLIFEKPAFADPYELFDSEGEWLIVRSQGGQGVSCGFKAVVGVTQIGSAQGQFVINMFEETHEGSRAFRLMTGYWVGRGEWGTDGDFSPLVAARMQLDDKDVSSMLFEDQGRTQVAILAPLLKLGGDGSLEITYVFQDKKPVTHQFSLLNARLVHDRSWDKCKNSIN